MSDTPFAVCTGEVKIGANAGAAVSVKDAVVSLKLFTTRAKVTIPATWGTGAETPKAGGTTYELELDFLPDDTSASSLFSMLFDATDPTDNPTGELYFEARMHDSGPVGVDNPTWSGTFIATDVAIGGASNTAARHSARFPLTGRPTKATA